MLPSLIHENSKQLSVVHSAVRPYAEKADAELISTVRHELIDRIWHGLLYLALLGVPLSVSRSFHTGWMNMYGAHIAIGSAVVVCYLMREQLSFRARTGLLLVFFCAVGLIGLVTMGMLGAGLWWLSISCLLVSVLVSMRWGVISLLLVAAIVTAVGYGYVTESLSLSIDANAYVRSPAAWLTLLMGTTVMPVVVFQAIAGYQRATQALLEKVEAQRVQIEHLATHDGLTGLPRMNLADDRLNHALLTRARRNRKVAVLFIDLDGFKSVNDVHGHEAGDVVLKALSERMNSVVRVEDTIARKGGDEFIVILEDVLDQSCANMVAKKLIAQINAPVKYRATSLLVGASIGIALAPDHGIDADELLRTADAAMYDAKERGKNQCVVATGPLRDMQISV